MSTAVLKPDVKFLYKLFLLTVLLGLLTLAASLLLGVGIGSDAGGRAGALLGMWIVLGLNALWLVPTLALLPAYYRSLRYEIREDEVIVFAGIITRSVKHVPFRTVTNLKVARGPFDRLFGLGTLNIQTAGMSGQTGAEESLMGLPDVGSVYEEVARALRRFRGGMSPTQAEEEMPAAGDSLPAILHEIRSIRAVLESR